MQMIVVNRKKKKQMCNVCSSLTACVTNWFVGKR